MIKLGSATIRRWGLVYQWKDMGLGEGVKMGYMRVGGAQVN